jgi:hypothetical protein
MAPFARVDHAVDGFRFCEFRPNRHPWYHEQRCQTHDVRRQPREKQ